MPVTPNLRLFVVCTFTIAVCLGGNLAVFVLLRNNSFERSTHLPINLAQATLTVQPPSARFGLRAEESWASMFHGRPGFVRLADRKVYSISMFHQLHCLNRMRQIFLQLHDRTTHALDDAHVEHCLSYLGQMVLCAADTTLEPSARINVSDGTQTSVAWAEGTVHECRDWTQLMDWTEANYMIWKDTALAGHPTEPGM